MMMADCEHCGGVGGGGWLMEPPPEFSLPPPPLPPFMQPELCNSAVFDPSAETCQAFLVEDAEFQVPLDSPPSLAAIVVSAAILTTLVILIATLLLWRYRKQKEQHKVVLRCQQKSGLNGGGVMDTVPALLQGLAGGGSGNNRRGPGLAVSDDVDGVFYDELISYPTHYRTPHHQPPAYEMKDVLLKTSPCHCTAHPLLGRGTTGRGSLLQCSPPQHYVTSPYHSSSNSSSTPTTTNADDRADSGGSWIAEHVYEELPSGPEEDFRSPRDQRRNQHCYFNGSTAGINHSLLRGSQRGGSFLRRNGSNNWSGGSEEPCETDLFLAPTTWYQQHNSLRGQLTAQGPVRPGRGGIKAAWKELEPAKVKRKNSKQQSSNGSSSSQQHLTTPTPSAMHYQSTELYRGRCPPEAPPVSCSLDDEDGSPLPQPDPITPEPRDATPTSGTKTLPRYYYYSESDDYGVNNPVQRTYSSNTGRRGYQQRHLSRTHRTSHRSPTSDLA